MEGSRGHKSCAPTAGSQPLMLRTVEQSRVRAEGESDGALGFGGSRARWDSEPMSAAATSMSSTEATWVAAATLAGASPTAELRGGGGGGGECQCNSIAERERKRVRAQHGWGDTAGEGEGEVARSAKCHRAACRRVGERGRACRQGTFQTRRESVDCNEIKGRVLGI